MRIIRGSFVNDLMETVAIVQASFNIRDVIDNDKFYSG